MKYVKRIFLFLFIIILFVSLLFNIIIINSKKIPQLNMFKLDAIYFDLSLINDRDKADQIYEFINSNNNALFSNVINQKENPIAQFYAFCGYMKGNQKKAIKYLDTLLLSQKKVNIIIDKKNKKINYELGFAFLKLIKEFPEQLISSPIKDFFLEIEDALLKAYKSPMVENNQEYKKELLALISNSTPNLSKVVLGDLLKGKSIKDMPFNDKIEFSYILPSLPSDERSRVIKIFLTENNKQILLNTLNSIDENDSSTAAELILRLFYKKKSIEVTQLAVEKYALILKKESLEQIENFMRVIKNKNVILICLEQIMRYGDDTDYEFLKRYLMESYSEEINLAALKAIIETTYKHNTEDVLNTMSFILRKSKKEALALYAVRFHMENSIKTNYGSVLYRLRQKESKDMKNIAIKYIDHFNLKSGISLLEELSNEPDIEIQEKANKLLKKFGVTPDNISNTDNTDD